MLSLAVLLVSGSAAAGPAVGARFLNVPASVRQMGMGGVALGEPDVLRTWSNPAALGALDARAQIAFNGGSGDRDIEQAVSGGGGFRLSDALSLGALFSYRGLTFDEVDAAGAKGAAVGRTSTAFGVAGCWSWRWLNAGVTLKGVSDSSAQDTEKLTAGAADAGVVATFQEFTAGAAFRNAGTALHADDATIPGGVSLPTELRAGIAYRFPSLLVGAEMVTGSGPGAGLAFWVSDELAVRGGMARIGQPDAAITAGFSALLTKLGALKNVGVDYGLALQSPYAEHRVNLSVAFGALPGTK